MSTLQAAKTLILDYYSALDSAQDVGTLKNVLQRYTAADYIWRAFHPFGEITDANTVVDKFWGPFKTAMTSLQRRQDIFFAGQNSLTDDGGIWVVSMGHLMGLFDATWLGIRPSRKLTMLRYCEFNLVVDGQITQTAFYFDIPHLMVQAGQNPFGPQTAAHLVQPGPRPHTGLLFDDAPDEEGEKTLSVINAMITDLGQWNSGLTLEEELAQTWHDDMLWWGPEGIGATYTIERYAKQHSGPFRAAFSERSKTNHIARLAEGHYGGFFGWPNFTTQHDGGFMGLPASKDRLAFNVIDIYRREGDKLAENWIFIDILSMFHQQGVDLLERNAKING